MPPRWTRTQEEALRRLYERGRSVDEIATALGRSPDAVVARRRHLRVPARGAAGWSPREDALLRLAVRNGVSAAWLSNRLGRTPEAVRWRKRKLLGHAAAPQPYTAREDEAIRRRFADRGDLDALARDLGRSVDAVRLRAETLGAHHPKRRRRWSFAEDAIVRDGYDAGRSCASIAGELTGRSADSVAARARKLGISNYARLWTDEDDALLMSLVERRRSTIEIARVLTRTPEAVRRRSRRLGSTTAAPTLPRSGRPWTEREDTALRLNAGANPASLAEALGRSDRAVAARLRVLGLRAGRERSPHHPARNDDRLSPAQRSTILREADPERPQRLLAIARRLDVPSRTLRAAAGMEGDRQTPRSRHATS